MIRSRHPFLAVALLVALASCSAPIGYQERDLVWGPFYGYEDKRISEDEFSITTIGDVFTPAERVANITLLRAAYLTREQSATHFIVVTKKDQDLERMRLDTLPNPFYPFAPMYVGELPNTDRIAIMVIRVLPPDESPPLDAVDAKDVIARLKDKLNGG